MSGSRPKTISLDKDILAKAQARQAQFGYKSFSAYIEALIRADFLDASDTHLRVAEDKATQKLSKTSSAKVQEIADAIEAEALSKIAHGRVRKKRGVPVHKPGLKVGLSSKAQDAPHEHAHEENEP